MSDYSNINSKFHFIGILILACVLIGISSCGGTENCYPYGDVLDIRYIHDGQNAIFGEHAIVNKDSISLSTLDGSESAKDIVFVDSTKSLQIFLEPGQTHILSLGSIRSDTLYVSKWLEPLGRDCAIFLIMDVLLDNKPLCESGCLGVIDLSF